MVSVIIAAAGSGSRMNSSVKKQFMTLLEVPILVRTLRKFDLTCIDEIIIVTNSDDVGEVQALLKVYGISKVTQVIAGGNTRQASIYNGLKAVGGDYVLVHDAARPFVTRDIIEAHVASLSNIGLITAVPCKDTIKVVADGFVKETLDRSVLMNVQTPQSFETESLLKAYDHAALEGLSVTDDASVYEAFGLKVKVVLGSYDNIKITTPEDLVQGEIILKRGKK